MAVLEITLPKELEGYEHDLRRFFDAMVFKLRKNANKGKWESYSIDVALDLLDNEVAELRRAVSMDNCVEITLEAADVGNFGLIISAIAIERGQLVVDRKKLPFGAKRLKDVAEVAAAFAPERVDGV